MLSELVEMGSCVVQIHTDKTLIYIKFKNLQYSVVTELQRPMESNGQHITAQATNHCLGPEGLHCQHLLLIRAVLLLLSSS